NPYEFYKCFKTGKCIVNNGFPYLGSVKFHYVELENRDTNRIAYLRNDMVVYAKPVYGFGSIGYCGVFLCDDRKGNEILRAMEPPTHDSFDPDRLQDKMKDYNVRQGQDILDKIKQYVKNALQEILDQYTKPAEDIKWLDDLLASLTGIGGSGT